jgi:uncharacterized protein DUF5666
MRLTPRSWRTLAVAIGTVLGAFAGCGGERVAGIEGSGLQPAATSVVTTGRITGFGSIIVDGVEYATSGAQIRVDDQPATEAQLRVGYIVTIRGTLNGDGSSGTAAEVSFETDARGAVVQKDVAAGTFVVLGQTIRATDETIFDEDLQASDVSALPAGGKIQVSGFVDASGTLVASRIAAAASDTLQVKGAAQALDTAARSFRINGLTVDYASSTVSGALGSGSVVTVRGNTLAASGTLVASEVIVESPSSGGGGNETRRLEGLITSFTSNSDFVVDGQRITTDGSTQFALHGQTLGPDVQVKVQGKVNDSGVLVATKVEAKEGPGGTGGGPGATQGAALVRGVVDSVSAVANTVTVLGVTANVSTNTALEDRSPAHVKTFRLSDVRTGDYVEVRGTFSGGVIGATLLQRDKPENRSYVQGTALNVAEPTLTILGLAVTTNEQTQFKGVGGGNAQSAEFFSSVDNKTVKARGTLNGTTLVADQVQIVK